MFEDMVKRVTEATGITEDSARGAVTEVLSFLKEKLPEPLAGYFDKFLEGSAEEGTVGKIMGTLGGFFGGKKEDS